MTKPLLALALAAAVLANAGCVGISTQYEGNPITKENLAKIKVGVTNRSQVLETLGSPLVIDRTDITGLAERVLSRFQGEELSLKIDPSLFNDVYIYERREVDRWLIFLGFFTFVTSDERSDRLSVFFDKDGLVLGMGWTEGTADL